MPKPDESVRVRKISLNSKSAQDIANAWNGSGRIFLKHNDKEVLIILDNRVPPGEIPIEKG